MEVHSEPVAWLYDALDVEQRVVASGGRGGRRGRRLIVIGHRQCRLDPAVVAEPHVDAGMLAQPVGGVVAGDVETGYVDHHVQRIQVVRRLGAEKRFSLDAQPFLIALAVAGDARAADGWRPRPSWLFIAAVVLSIAINLYATIAITRFGYWQ